MYIIPLFWLIVQDRLGTFGDQTGIGIREGWQIVAVDAGKSPQLPSFLKGLFDQ